MQFLISVGAGSVVAVIFTAVIHLPWPLRVALFIGVLLIAAALVLAAYGWWRDRRNKPSDLLKAQHLEGRRLLRQISLKFGSAGSSEEAEQAAIYAQRAVGEWTSKTWERVVQHFYRKYEHEFAGPSADKLGPAGVHLDYLKALRTTYQDSPEDYLKDKLSLIDKMLDDSQR
jgi:hypothetical protein